MTFKSRKGIFFSLLTIGFALVSTSLCFLALFANEAFVPTPLVILFLLTSGLLLWAYFGTKYELTKDSLKYRSAFLRGTIQVNRIHTIIKNKTMLSGIKPATAGQGLIVKFDTYDEIYISPASNDSFVEYLKGLNPQIKIEE